MVDKEVEKDPESKEQKLLDILSEDDLPEKESEGYTEDDVAKIFPGLKEEDRASMAAIMNAELPPPDEIERRVKMMERNEELRRKREEKMRRKEERRQVIGSHSRKHRKKRRKNG